MNPQDSKLETETPADISKKCSGICVVVLGMHRSGTSAVAGTLSKIGVFFGDKLLPPAPYNPKGFYEHIDILTTNEEILHTLDSSFQDISPLPLDWHKNISILPLKDRLREIIERDFSDKPIFGFKDPRVSILLPLYLDIFREMNLDVRFVVCERPNVEIAYSLAERIQYSMYKSLQLCSKYKTAIEEGIQGQIYTRVQMNDFVNNPEASIKHIIATLKIPVHITEVMSRDISDFIDRGLKHHNLTVEDVLFKVAEDLDKTVIDSQNNLKEIEEDKKKLKEHFLQLQKRFDEQAEHLVHLESQSYRLHNTLAHRDHRIQFLEQEVSKFVDIDLADHYKTQEEINHLRDKIDSIQKSLSWKIVYTIQRTLDVIIPPRSIVRRPYIKALKILQNKTQKSHDNTTEYISTTDFKAYVSLPVVQPDILFINHEESRTGAPRIIFEIAKSALEKYSIAIISKVKGGMSAEFKEAFDDKLYYPHELLEQRERHEVARIMLEKIKPKLVYVNSIVSYEYACEAKKLGIPVIFHIHEMANAYDVAISAESHADFASFADVFIVVSEATKRDLIQVMKVSEDCIRLIHEFIDAKKVIELSQYKPRRVVEEILGIDSDDILIVSMGTFDKRKGGDYFIKLAKRFADKKVKMLWVGRRPRQHDLFALVFQENRDSFLHIDEVPNPFPFLARADIFFMSSREDPFPLVVLEAMALQKPVVAFAKAGGAVEAGGGSVACINNFNVDEAYKVLHDLVIDEEDRQRRGVKGKEQQKLYEKDQIIDKIYKEIDLLMPKNK
jgi:glycosyltransferase involved in cell wall biosynthesis